MNTLSQKNNPILIGVTGGMGSGKSTVVKVLNSFGIPSFNSDFEAKKLINTSLEIRSKIENAFGNVYNERRIDRLKLAEIVFNNEEKLNQLNAIVHPEVKKAFESWILENNGHKLLVKEAAILIESGAYKELDKIILVTSPVEERIRRVMNRDGVRKEDVMTRISKQLTDEEKNKFVDYVIKNEEPFLITPQIENILSNLDYSSSVSSSSPL